ncbi:DUF104 domain-containing protein [Thermococcus sp. MAR1]|nr:DUF104 domain-containing protein [Thermococcus sp. MAR1]
MGIRAVYRNGVFKPLDKVDLPEGTQVEILIADPKEAIKRYAGALRGLKDVGDIDWEEAYHEHILKRAGDG